jgi:hypothetical protein
MLRVKSIASVAVILLCVAILSPSGVVAATLFSNFGPSQSYDVNTGTVIGNDFAGNNLAEGSTFTLSASATFGSLSVALSCSISCPDLFTVSLRRDSGADTPGTLIESFTRSGTLLGSFGVQNAPLVFNSALSPTLTGGTQYWLTVSSDIKNSIVWNSNTTGDPSDQATSSDGGATWFSPSGLTPGAYEVDSLVTPLPAALPLFATGLGALGLLGWRRKRNTQATA